MRWDKLFPIKSYHDYIFLAITGLIVAASLVMVAPPTQKRALDYVVMAVVAAIVWGLYKFHRRGHSQIAVGTMLSMVILVTYYYYWLTLWENTLDQATVIIMASALCAACAPVVSDRFALWVLTADVSVMMAINVFTSSQHDRIDLWMQTFIIAMVAGCVWLGWLLKKTVILKNCYTALEQDRDRLAAYNADLAARLARQAQPPILEMHVVGQVSDKLVPCDEGYVFTLTVWDEDNNPHQFKTISPESIAVQPGARIQARVRVRSVWVPNVRRVNRRDTGLHIPELYILEVYA